MSVSTEAIVFVFGVLLAIIGFLIVRIMDAMKDDFKQTKDAAIDAIDEVKKLALEALKSVQELNIKIAIVIERTEMHDEKIGLIEIQQNQMNHQLQTLSGLMKKE